MDRDARLSAADEAIQGAGLGRSLDHWDHRYVYVDPVTSSLRTVCFIATSVLAYYVREYKGARFLVSDANVLACTKCDNPTEKGILAEKICISQLSLEPLPMIEKRILPKTVHFYTDTDVHLSLSDRVVHYVPIAFNYAHIDSLVRVLTFKRGTSELTEVDLYAVQDTLQTVANHASSLNFFDDDYLKWIKDIPKGKVKIRWHFVWVLTEKNRDTALLTKKSLPREAKKSTPLSVHGVSNVAHGSVTFTEWFYAFHDILPNLRL